MPLLNYLHNAHTLPLDNDLNFAAIGPGEELGSPEFWWKILISTCLVLLGGVLSGYVASRRKLAPLTPRHVRLTLGLMGLDELHLRVLSTSSENEKERKDAAKGNILGRAVENFSSLSPSSQIAQQGPSLGAGGKPFSCALPPFELFSLTPQYHRSCCSVTS